MALYLVRLAIMRARQSSKAYRLTRLFSKVWFPFQVASVVNIIIKMTDVIEYVHRSTFNNINNLNTAQKR